MSRLVISEKDILEAEAAILGEDSHFNDEQKAFIKCIDTVDLTACPGSGKTTTLVAKLYILAKYEVWTAGDPLCVISHTRIAVEEIKHKVASHFPKIMDYPNFIGTIQEFTDRYLAIPYYKSLGYGEIKAIDDDIFLSKWKTQNIYGLRTYLFNRGGCLTEDDYHKKIANIKYHHDKSEKIDPAEFSLANTNSNSYVQGLAAKEALFKSGYLTYADTRVLATSYLEHYPNVTHILKRRFSYVFLDEAQDTSAEQMNILEQFADSECYQRIGDPLQTIFNADSETTDVWQIRGQTQHMRLSVSTRFGSQIGNLVNFVGQSLSDGSVLTCANDDGYQNCVMVLFDDNNPLSVMEWFEEFVEQELSFLEEKSVYVIGAVGKEKPDRFTINSYVEGYSNDRRSRLEYFKNASDYFSDINKVSLNALGSNLVYSRLTKLFAAEIREFNPSLSSREIRDRLAQESPAISSLVIDIIKAINTDEPLPIELITGTLRSEAKRLFDIDEVRYEFSPQDSSLSGNTIPPVTYDRVYEISTVHGVKGQTHDATLLLTTQFHSTGASRATGEIGGTDLDYLVHSPASPRDKRRRRLLYVSASRSKYLFVWAVPKSKRSKASALESIFTQIIEI